MARHNVLEKLLWQKMESRLTNSNDAHFINVEPEVSKPGVPFMYKTRSSMKISHRRASLTTFPQYPRVTKSSSHMNVSRWNTSFFVLNWQEVCESYFQKIWGNNMERYNEKDNNIQKTYLLKYWNDTEKMKYL